MFMDYTEGANGWKYETTKDVVIKTNIFPKNAILTGYFELSLLGNLVIKKGYNYDGATGAIDTDTIMLGSLVHDCFYQMMREGYLDKSWRPESDLLLKTLCLLEGMLPFRAEYVYKTVRLIGWYFVR